MIARKYLILVTIIVFASFGDISLSYGMKHVGAISATRWTELIAAVFNPWVAIGIVLLLGFLAAYMTALSWYDLTFVLPATSFGYVLLALLSIWLLGENVSVTRWIGILLVSSGVAIVTQGPSATRKEHSEPPAGDQP